jgi:hypothetical protein
MLCQIISCPSQNGSWFLLITFQYLILLFSNRRTGDTFSISTASASLHHYLHPFRSFGFNAKNIRTEAEITTDSTDYDALFKFGKLIGAK